VTTTSRYARNREERGDPASVLAALAHARGIERTEPHAFASEETNECVSFSLEASSRSDADADAEARHSTEADETEGASRRVRNLSSRVPPIAPSRAWFARRPDRRFPEETVFEIAVAAGVVERSGGEAIRRPTAEVSAFRARRARLEAEAFASRTEATVRSMESERAAIATREDFPAAMDSSLYSSSPDSEGRGSRSSAAAALAAARDALESAAAANAELIRAVTRTPAAKTSRVLASPRPELSSRSPNSESGRRASPRGAAPISSSGFSETTRLAMDRGRAARAELIKALANAKARYRSAPQRRSRALGEFRDSSCR
jgi:hypothetical protein